MRFKFARNSRQTLPSSRRLSIESLETRRLLTVVTDLGDDGSPGQLRTLLADPTVDTITFDVSGTIQLTMGALVVDRDLVVNGVGQDVTIDAGGQSRVFYIDDGDDLNLSTVELRQLTITGGYTSGGPRIDGGAGVATREMTVMQSVTITGNESTTNGGGLVANGAGEVDVQDSIISGNTAANRGGGVYLRPTTGASFFDQTDFAYNESTYGGAVDATGELWLYQSNLRYNTATMSGGGIFNAGRLNFDQSLAGNNLAAKDGGAIFSNGTAYIVDSELLDNRVQNALDFNAQGAALANFGSAEIVGSTISGNVAFHDDTNYDRVAFGGGILNANTIRISSSFITANTADIGGGVRIADSGYSRIGTNTAILANTARELGGGVFVTRDALTRFEGVSISGNEALGAGLGGGLMASDDSNIQLWQTLVSGNSAANSGGGLHVESFLGAPTNILLDDARVIDNTADRSGGGIALRDNAGEGTMIDSIVRNNQAENGAGLDISGSLGGIAVARTSVYANTATFDGGGIRLSQEANFGLNDGMVFGNTAGNHGGGIRVADGQLDVVDSDIFGNVASGNGGGLHISGMTPSPNFGIINSKVHQNSATYGGGVMVTDGRELTISHSTLSENTASQLGGGLSVQGEAHVMVWRSTLSGNEGLGGGGGLSVIYGALDVGQSTISGNRGPFGGGMHLFSYGNRPGFNFDSTTITDNQADQRGGGVLLTGGDLLLNNSIVAGNQAAMARDIMMPTGTTATLALEFSLLGDNDGSPLMEASPDAKGNLVGGPNGVIDPMLSPLQLNGGSTETHLPYIGSPVIDTGDPAILPNMTLDQRFQERVVGARVDMGSVEFGVVLDVNGDFNNDGAWDCDDIDLLVAEIAAEGTNLLFDLTGDGVVSIEDIRDPDFGWLRRAGEQNLGAGRSYLIGDANLDGVVDGFDFISWNANKFTNGAGWCGGDFNADGAVDGQDFILWNQNKFMAS